MAAVDNALGGFARGLGYGLLLGDRMNRREADSQPAGKSVIPASGAADASRSDAGTGEGAAGKSLPTYASQQGSDSSTSEARAAADKLPTFAKVQGAEPSAAIGGVINDTALKYGIDPTTFRAMGHIESRFDPNAKNPSGASGLFQMMPGTWKQYGNGGNVFDPAANADAAARLYKDNESYLAKRLGRAPTAGEMYLAHQQGMGGAAKLLANPNARAADVVGLKAVTANGGKADMTAGQFASLWTRKFDGVYGSMAERQQAQAREKVASEAQQGGNWNRNRFAASQAQHMADVAGQSAPRASMDEIMGGQAAEVRPAQVASDPAIPNQAAIGSASNPWPVSSVAVSKMRAALFGPTGNQN